MTLHSFLQGFFADRFFASLALATVVFMGWLAWMTIKEYRAKRHHQKRYLRRVHSYSHV